MQILRPYQHNAVEAVFDAMMMGYTRIVYTAPTGSGKTTTFAEITKHLLSDFDNWRVLILVDSRELVSQAYRRVRDHCGLNDFQIGVESNTNYAEHSNRVVVATIQTVVSEKRLNGWTPQAIICDEAHITASASYQKVFLRYGVKDGACTVIGCTATLKRLDKKSLAAEKPDGTPYMLEDKKGKRFPADKETSVYETHCFDYSLLSAIEDGWLVPIRGKILPVPIDLSKVKSASAENGESDFNQKDLAEETDRDEVNSLIVSAWIKEAENRQTIAFCASVHHARAVADTFNAAGIAAVAVDCETDDVTRYRALEDFRDGAIKVLCNFGVYGKGVDVDTCACILMAHLTMSWTRYMQRAGRGTRVLDGLLNGMEEALPEARIAKIAASAKKDCLILDLVGVSGKHNLCTAPVMLDLPTKLNLEGRSLTEAKLKLEQYETVKQQAIDEEPATFTIMEARMEEIDLLSRSRAKSKDKWLVADSGSHLLSQVPVGYTARVDMEGETRVFRVKHKSEVLYEQPILVSSRPGLNFKGYLDFAEQKAHRVIQQHRAETKHSNPRGTLEALSEGRRKCLYANGHRDEEIDCMPMGYALKLVGQYMDAFKRGGDTRSPIKGRKKEE